ncbi:DUF87 domain-containing protein [Candidatus Parcubacteria bacterium]|nr:MAG: DUF87 domain-containing protein [Candidatus Parcubacteria bacterium]
MIIAGIEPVIGVENPVYNSVIQNQQIIFISDVIILVLLLAMLFILVKLFLQRKELKPIAFRKVILEVALPKEASHKSDEKYQNKENTAEQIALAENLFSVLGGQRAQKGFKAWLWGREDHFSLEIVLLRGLIYFYIAVPVYMKQFLEQHIAAQYPEALIKETEDYNIFSPQGKIKGCYLKFSREYFFPIKTYNKLAGDSLNAITNSLSKISPEDGAAIQIIARSAKKKWHYLGSRIAKEMHKGRKLSEARALSRPFTPSGIIYSLFSKPQTAKMQSPAQAASPMEQELIKGLEEKTSKAGLDTNIRIIVSAKTDNLAQTYLKNIVESFSQFNYYQYGNTFKISGERTSKIVRDFIYRNYLPQKRVLLNCEELASIYHLPSPFIETPNIRWLLAKTFPAPINAPEDGLVLGENIYRENVKKICIKTDDRRRHMYIIGMTGTGKSNLMSEMAKQDILAGNGLCIIDPHGNLIENVLPCIPESRAEDVIIFDPSDVERPVGLNMLEAENPEQVDFAIQEMIAIFYKLVTDPSMIGPMFEHNMRNAMLTLMADAENPGTIAEIPRIFTDPAFQKYKLAKVTDPMVWAFWEKEMAKTSDFHKSEMLGYLISKVGRFVENQMIRNIIGQPKSKMNFKDIIRKKRILLINLCKGKIGEMNSNLLGLIFVSKLQMAAFAGASLAEDERNDFYLYIDEFQNFITESISTILAEARKYRLNLILAHQYLGQLTGGSSVEGKTYGERIKDAIFGNVGTIVSFRIGVEDTETIAKQFAPNISEYDLMNMEKYNAYIRLLIDNQSSKTFNLRTYPPTVGDKNMAAKLKEMSRLKYGRHKKIVEQEIMQRSKLGESNSSIGQTALERTL